MNKKKKDWRQKEKGWQMMNWLDSTTDSMDMILSKLWEIVEDRECWHATAHGVAKSWTLFNDWTAIGLYGLDALFGKKKILGWPESSLGFFCKILAHTIHDLDEP